jgi:hypothetical protein
MSWFKSKKYYKIEYILSKIAQFLVYLFFVVYILSLIKYLVTCQ